MKNTGNHGVCSMGLANAVVFLLQVAAQQLSVGVTTLKKICRRAQVYRWPFRKRTSIERLIERTEYFLPLVGDDPELQEHLAALQALLAHKDDFKVCMSPPKHMLMPPTTGRDELHNWFSLQITLQHCCATSPCAHNVALESLPSGCCFSAELKWVLYAVQQACQRGELHASLKAFRQSVFKKVYKEQKEPRERRKAAKPCRAGELPYPPSLVFVVQGQT